MDHKIRALEDRVLDQVPEITEDMCNHKLIQVTEMYAKYEVKFYDNCFACDGYKYEWCDDYNPICNLESKVKKDGEKMYY